MKKLLFILTLTLSTFCYSNDNDKECTKIKSSKLSFPQGAWKVTYTSDQKMYEGMITIWKTANEKYQLFIADNQRTSSIKGFYGCEAEVYGATESEKYLQCTNNSNIRVGEIIKATDSWCEDERTNSKLPSNQKDGILEYKDITRFYKKPICYVIYNPVGPGEGSGSAGNTSGG